MSVEVDWQIVALVAAAVLCLGLAYYFGVEWLLGAGAAAGEAARRGRSELPPAEPVDDVEPETEGADQVSGDLEDVSEAGEGVTKESIEDLADDLRDERTE